MEKGKRTVSFTRAIALITFLPFLGWLLPLYSLSGDEKAQNNAKVSMLAAVLAFSTLLAINLVSFFVPSSLVFIYFVFSAALYAVVGVYLVFCFIGTIFVVRNAEFKMPLVSGIASKLQL